VSAGGRPRALTLVAALALVAAALGLVGAAAASGEAVPGGRLRIVDVHAHPVRSAHRRGMAASADEILEVLDRFDVERVVLLPPPFTPGHGGEYGLAELQALVRGGHGRIAMIAGGESLNVLIQATPADDVGAGTVKAFRREAEAIAGAGAVGFGEIAIEHLSSGRGGHPYESVPADHPLLRLLADIAAERGMVVDVHMEAVPAPMPTPPARGGGGRNPPELRANIDAFERLLEHNRAARIVWSHAGWDLTGERTVPLMRRLLERHPNLFMSIKTDGAGTRRTAPLDGDRLRPEWLALLRRFPDRFVIGSDQFFDAGTGRLARVREVVDALPAELARAVGRDNALRLYRLSPAP
jgi:predicted TIM-barrel fold metal-dependent hydrolase